MRTEKSEDRPKMSDEAKFVLVFALSGLVAVVSFVICQLRDAPEHKREARLTEELEQAELAVFGALRQHRLINETSVQGIDHLEAEVMRRRKEADAIWDSIRPGEAIARDGVGGYRPVGKNEAVSKLHEQANSIEADLTKQKRELALSHGPNLASTPSSTVWKNREKIRLELVDLHKTHGWYYEGPLGDVLKIFFVVTGIAGFIASGLAAISGIWLVFWVLGGRK
jgi:hypothetical protein